MATLSDIKRRIKSVKNTRQITKAMKMVSAAKLRRAQEEMLAARPYAEKIKSLAASMASKVTPESHPLLSKGSGEGKTELILIASDRGLCGGFNGQLIRTAERFVREHPEVNVSMNLIGRRAMEYFKSRSIPIVKARPFGNGRPTYAAAVEIAEDCVKGYMEGRSGEVYLIYSEFKSILTQKPVVQKLLPVTPESEVKEELAEFLFEPSEEGVLSSLLPKYIEVQLFKGLLESSASEYGARMTAMDSASKNASEMINGLTLKYNRVRQSVITKELMEIIGGAEALK
ncbi:MAG: ATP synthase F1 subunit gamma [Thermodesulfobacteriota bacterium]